ncbi:BREX-2 system adenine-specific DNA-methyltransferase PglX [Frankia sp. CiP3]|uniref:BREX-2 system adenine-specific DNA-methyltransferase PglX n=1 Tax=Frankia sp. CiP3 TaxID=2880971 RepID=UPI0021027356|nr:BREX-2 system adenine-specific DNA-methyltransferase PglX [Frankia sp. CiP3]
MTSTDRSRNIFSSFPWSLGGGGATETQNLIENATKEQLATATKRIGFYGDPHSDETFFLPDEFARKLQIPEAFRPKLIRGEGVRDWSLRSSETAILPYQADRSIAGLDALGRPLVRHLWKLRTVLGNRRLFSGESYFNGGYPWHGWHQLPRDQDTSNRAIFFAFVGTHNNFVRGAENASAGRTAPVIKLPVGASEDEHLRLLGVLNSSTACFWLKQVSQPKGGSGIGRGVQDEAWENRYEFTGTKLEEFPLPTEYPLGLARELDGLAQQLTAVSPASVAVDDVPTRARLADAQAEWASARARMIALQEELDWQVYRQYGLLADELTLPIADVPEIRLGERAFEIVLARRIADGDETSEWFSRHGSTPITEVPAHWPAEYRAHVEKRIAVIESDRNIGLIERPEYKRRWATEGWDKLRDAALRDWLLDRLETRDLWFADVDGMAQPRLWTTGQLADELAADADFVSVAEIYRPGEELAKVVAALVEDEHVPFLAALRYTDTGLVKRADWESVWDQQRAEDAAPTPAKAKEIHDAIPVPPKYAPKDFRKTSFWRARGKLDVPKERFISYQPAGRDNDPTLLIGWAGFDHREQAQALATLIVDRRDNDGWDGTRLTPLVAGLREVMPWVRQWHDEVDPRYDGSPAEVYDAFLADTMGQLTLTEEALTSWRPPTPTRGRRAAQ